MVSQWIGLISSKGNPASLQLKDPRKRTANAMVARAANANIVTAAHASAHAFQPVAL